MYCHFCSLYLAAIEEMTETRGTNTAAAGEGVTMKLVIMLLSLLLATEIQTCLAADQTICNPGSTISYYPNGQLKSCPLKDIFPIAGVTCNVFAQITFFELGMLRSCVTRDFFNYDGITCNQYGEVSFYPSGKLDTCILATRAELDGKVCAELQPISLFEDGKLKSCGTPTLSSIQSNGRKTEQRIVRPL